MWDKLSARACVMPDPLSASPLPTLGTGAHALASPCPYGVGVYSVLPDGRQRPLPLYFVSEPAACARPAGVHAGWYVVATPGTQFELRLTGVQPRFPSLRGRRLPAGSTVDAHLSVDGVRITRNRVNGAFEEIVSRGFVESMRFAAGCAEGTQRVRRFRVQRRAVGGEGEARGEAEGEMGCICVRMVSGKLVAMENTEWAETKGMPGGRGVSEREAEKMGRSVGVAGDEGAVGNRLVRQREHLRYPKEEGKISIFLRERVWLEARHIVDADGGAWKPVRAVVDLGDEMRPELRELVEVPLGLRKRKGEISDIDEHEEAGEMRGKAVKTRRRRPVLSFD